MYSLRIYEAVDFIGRFKPATHPENPDLMVIDLRLPRDEMQDLCSALTEIGLRHYLSAGGMMICFDRHAYELLNHYAESRVMPERVVAVA